MQVDIRTFLERSLWKQNEGFLIPMFFIFEIWTNFGCVAKRKLICQNGEKSRKRGPVMAEQHPLKWRHVEAEVILLCVRWYLRDAVPLLRSGRDDAGEGPG